MREHRILVGSSKGLFEIIKESSNSWGASKKHLEDNWVSSILSTHEKIYITTKDGHFFEFCKDLTHIVNKNKFNFRLWFSFINRNSIKIVGGAGGRIAYRDHKNNWKNNYKISDLSKKNNWKSHSGGDTHLHTVRSNPSNSEHQYCGIEVGGVAHSMDDGISWSDITFNLDPDVHCLAFDQNGNLTVATGTGVFTLDPSEKKWRILGTPILSYCQGIVYRPSSNSFFVSVALEPFGRVTGSRFSGIYSGNKFGIFEITKNGFWTEVKSEYLKLSGVLSKAIVCVENIIYLATADGSVYQIDTSNRCTKLFGCIPGIVECIEVI